MLTKAQKTRIKNWIEMLESGQFTQTIGLLKNDILSEDSYCCLGVACELYATEVGGFWDNINWFYADENDCKLQTLPSLVREWLGIDKDIQDTLTIMNDMEKKSFPEIATYLKTLIEE